MPLLRNFFEQTTEAVTQDELYKLYQQAIACFGFDIFVHSLITDHPSINKKSVDHYVGKIMPGWYDHYSKNEYQNIDPIRSSLHRFPGPRIWNDLSMHTEISPSQQRFLQEVDAAGFHNGVTIPIYGPRGEVAALSVASSDGKINHSKYMLSVLQSLSQQMHSVSVVFDSKRASPEVRLTDREREILQWLAQGKSNTVIASILSISENGVKFHLKNIFMKLDISSRQTAVIKAIKAGLISL